MLYPPSPPPLHFTSRGVSEQLCVCVSVGRPLSRAARPLFLFPPPSSVRWRHILLENTPAAYVQSRGAGKTEGKSYHLLLVGRKQYFSRRCLPPPCLVWARRPFPKRAILATRHKKEEGRRRKTAAHFLTCMPDRPRHTQVFLLPFSSSLGGNATIWQQKEEGMGCNTRLRPTLLFLLALLPFSRCRVQGPNKRKTASSSGGRSPLPIPLGFPREKRRGGAH